MSRRLKIAIPISLLIAGSALFWLRPNEKSILEAAIPVANVDSASLFKVESIDNEIRTMKNNASGLYNNNIRFAHYLWQNNDRFLTFKNTSKGLQCLTTKLGEAPGKVITSELPGSLLTENPFPVSLSNDGNVLFWHEQYGSWTVPNIMKFAGGNTEKRPVRSDASFYLSPDSKSLIYAFQKKSGFAIRSRDIENSAESTLFSVETELKTDAPSQLIFLSPDRLIVTGYSKTNSDYLSVFDCNLKNPSEPSKISTIKIPSDEKVYFSMLSPQGNRMLVETEKTAKPILIERLINNISARLFAKQAASKRRWYVYDLKGSKSELGFLDYSLTSNFASRTIGEPGIQIGGIKWTPDGKNISFIYQGKLYLLPVRG